jgi:signal transduction histidine kinase
VALGFGALGLILSLAFAAAAGFVAEDYEHILIATVLQAEADSAADALSIGVPPTLQRTRHLSGWWVHDLQDRALPDELRGLAPGIHEYETASGEEPHVGVFPLAEGFLVYQMDIGPIERLEEYLAVLMLLIVLIGGGLSAGVAWWLSGRVLAPLDALAARVSSLPVEPQLTAFAAVHSNDALGGLAVALDQRNAQLVASRDAERQFFADASHELRTPVTALQGAVEVLLDEPEMDPLRVRKLQRVGRSSQQLQQLLDAVLLIARGPGTASMVASEPVLMQSLQRLAGRARLQAVDLQIVVHADTPQHWCVAQRWLECALDNALRACIDAVAGSPLRVELAANTLQLGELVTVQKGARSDMLLGLGLIQRLVRQIGWQLECGLDAAGRPALCLRW